MTRILVTGATGNVGRRLVERLAARGVPTASASRAGRSPSEDVGDDLPVEFDWLRPDTHEAALRDVDRAFLVPPANHADPAAVMLPFVRLAATSGVRRVTLLSSSALESDAPGAGQVHAALPELVDEWAVLRPSWFMQNLTGAHLLGDGIRRHDRLTTATGDGRVPLIDAADIAASALATLVDGRGLGDEHVLTGARAWSYADVAAQLTASLGRPIRHEALGEQELADRLAATMPANFAALLASLDAGIARGSEDRVTDEVTRLTGHAPRDLVDYLSEHVDELGHVVGV